MESEGVSIKIGARVPLDLDRWLLIRDVRKLIWRHLTPDDREVVRCAQNARRVPQLSLEFSYECGRNGHLRRLQWAHALVDGLLWGAREGAMEGGHLDVLQWVYSEGTPIGTCSMAVSGGHLAILRWVRSIGSLETRYLHASAAIANRVNILQWLDDGGITWSPHNPSYAAANHGCLDALKWMGQRPARYPLDAFTCVAAARNGYLDVLQWLRAQGVPWDARVRQVAARHNHNALYAWAHANGCPQ